MADIATLGIEVKFGEAERAKSSLDNLSAAAQRAQSATGALSGVARTANAAVAGAAAGSDIHAAALRAEATAATQAATAIRAHGAAANQNSRGTGAAAANAANLSAQFNDVAVTAAAGASAMQIGLQQGLQMAQVLGPMGAAGAVKSLGAAFMLVLSPVNIVVIALTALLAAGIQMVSWSKSASSAISLLADSMDALAPYAAAAAAALALIYAPAMISGVVQMIALVARLGVAALSTAASFTAAWLAAMGPVGWLITGLATLGTAAYLLRDEIKAAIGVDVVEIMKGVGNTIINSFEAAYSDVTFIWANFGDMMGGAVVGGVNIAIRAINGLIEKSTQGIDKLLQTINPVLEYGGMAPFKPVSGALTIRELDNPHPDQLAKANAEHTEEIARIMGQDRLGGLGEAIGAGASAASGKLKELAEWMTKVDDKKKKRRGKSDADIYKDLISGAEKRVSGLRAELEAVDLTTEASARLRFEQELLADAQAKGLTLLPKQKERVRELASEYATLSDDVHTSNITHDLANSFDDRSAAA